MNVDYGNLLSTGLVFSILSFAIAVAALLMEGTLLGQSRALKILKILTVLGVYAIASWGTWHMLHARWELLVALVVGVSLFVGATQLFKGFSVMGNFLMASHVQATIFGLLWGLWIITTAPVSVLSRSLMLLGYPIAVFSLLVALIQSFEQWEVVCRSAWRRLRLPAAVPPCLHHPKVSLHVPTYAEPPALVIATLNALAKLDYPNFEVLVIDNNTTDPALWRPVEAHCRALGERFQFFHVEGLAGAKAGALNLALRHTAVDAELIGVIDSDYLVNTNFLAALVGFFDDPRLGFVQTPQAYRDWKGHAYLRMCQWEYKLVFSTTLISRNERTAAITVGTMGLIRRAVLDEVGGWAEWCVTEDSELSVRIHALGYKSLYFNTVFGTGLIPESFTEFKKQRFRWTYGPIQELRQHFRLFLPRPLARDSALTGAQKIHHLIHGLGALKPGLEMLMLPLSVAVGASMLWHGEAIPVAPFMWVNLGAAAIAAIALKWHLFRSSMGCSFKDMLGVLAVGIALDYIIRIAGVWGLCTRRTPWRRTNKFRALSLGLGALGSAIPELLLGSAILAAGIGILIVYQPVGLLLMFVVLALAQGSQYLAAPLLALVAEHGIRARSDRRELTKLEEADSSV